MRATKILFLDARYHHHGADMALAAAPGDQRMKNILDIDAIVLYPARFTRRALRLICKLAGSMTRHSIPRCSRNRANQKPS